MEQTPDPKAALRKIRAQHWKYSFSWGFGFLIAWSLYFYFWQGFYNFGTFISVLASAASTLIALSFAFGTLTFYTDFLDSKLGYRKYFGLTGFWFVILNLMLLILTDPRKNLFNPLKAEIALEQTLGLIAVLILTFMAAISNDSAMVKIGPRLWRNSLRLGYLIYFVLIPRAYIQEGHLWFEWAQNPLQTLPPPSLISSAAGIFVITFRLSVLPVKLLRQIFGMHKPKSIVSAGDHPHEVMQKNIT